MNADAEILRAWPDIRPTSVIVAQRGTNNRTYRVGSPQGEFILQVMLNVTDRNCLAAKHQLLMLLQELNPGFGVPAPLPAVDGSTIVAMAGESPRLCMLAPLIPGRHPDASDTGHIAAAATALGRLHHAFAQISGPARYTCGLRALSFAPQSTPFRDPETLIAALGLSPSMTTDVVRVLAHSTMTLAAIGSSQPTQIIHSDYYPSNVLIAGGNVSGILDFEFVSLGPRAYDVALGVWTFIFLWHPNDPSAWHRAEVFLSAYETTVSLVPHEWRHLADYIVIAEVHSFLHWSGRFIGGLVSQAEMEIRAQRLLDIDRWVTSHRRQLDHLAGRIAGT